MLPRIRWGRWLLLLFGGSALSFAALLLVAMLAVAVLILGSGASSETAMGQSPIVPLLTHGVDLQASQEDFAAALVACSGLDGDVARAWTASEGGGVNPSQPANNFLFLSATGQGDWRTFATPEDAAAAVCLALQGSLYTGIRASIGQAPILQLLAISESPWDAGHYGGDGSNLVQTYYGLLGSLTRCIRGSCPS